MLDVIRKLCQQKGITVSQLEAETGISKNSIYRWQANKPSIDKVQKVAAYFGVSTSELLGENIKKEPTNDSELDALREEVVDLIMGMSKSQLKKFLETAKALKNAKVFD